LDRPPLKLDSHLSLRPPRAVFRPHRACAASTTWLSVSLRTYLASGAAKTAGGQGEISSDLRKARFCRSGIRAKLFRFDDALSDRFHLALVAALNHRRGKVDCEEVAA
jgi:hypothetical protein